MEWSQDDEDTPTFATFLEKGAVYVYSETTLDVVMH